VLFRSRRSSEFRDGKGPSFYRRSSQESVEKPIKSENDLHNESLKMKKKELLSLEEFLGSNKKIASEIREKLTAKGILAINLLSSPGARKTTLLEKIAEILKPDYKMGVIEGDIETERDAERIRAKRIPA